ncbi:DNA replication complex GINS protein SLD5 [Copidosoma floridanum]|uniref:DNA replication complex GINS protein SLD5 n=1 Tax=Copidosoma floridanum TaxID=29053 RepID=UPI0006C99BCB|nr:DNA replication complex GINS protein SLD5 [Copidosoma floridanum]
MDSEEIVQFETLDDHNETEHYDQDNINTESHLPESEDDALTSEEVMRELENAWLNEKFAPELLPHQGDLIPLMLQQISHMESNLQNATKGDMRINIHTMEISRIRFIISSYLRKRLEKIEEYAAFLLEADSKRSPEEAFMTPTESRFAKEYVENVKKLFYTLALQHMPSRFQDFDEAKMSSKPNMNKHVFVRANKKIEGIMIPGSINEDEVDFEEGSQHIIKYSAVADLVKSGAVQLI